MRILDLTNPASSDIKYQISKFPDGQQQIKLLDFDYFIQIKSRLNNFQDLELIICAVKSLRNSYVKHIDLYIPYFLGSRSDRKFEDGSNNYLKDVICPIINSLNVTSITVLDPHSDVLEACLNKFQKISNEALVKFALADIYNHDSNEGNARIILVSPDSGASKKIYKVAKSFDFNGDIITCSKERNTDGALTKCIVPDFFMAKDSVIVDDICDGGNTFINISKQMKEMGHIGKSYLIVTHGIFSQGFEKLSAHFDRIYCTNSYKEISHPLVKQLNIF